MMSLCASCDELFVTLERKKDKTKLCEKGLYRFSNPLTSSVFFFCCFIMKGENRKRIYVRIYSFDGVLKESNKKLKNINLHV